MSYRVTTIVALAVLSCLFVQPMSTAHAERSANPHHATSQSPAGPDADEPGSEPGADPGADPGAAAESQTGAQGDARTDDPVDNPAEEPLPDSVPADAAAPGDELRAAAAPAPQYVPLSPYRLADSRSSLQLAGMLPARQTRGLALSPDSRIPADAGAVTLNVTVTQPTGPGWLTVFPCSSPVPLASNVNFAAGATVANQVTVKVGPRSGVGDICLHPSVGTHAVVDVSGYYPAGTEFRPMAAQRVADTRAGEPAPGPKGKVGGARILQVQLAGVLGIGPAARAAAANITVTQPESVGYLTVYPCGQPRPLASSLNFARGQTIANAATVGTGGNGAICIYSSTAAHVVVDVSGWYPPESDLTTMTPVRIVDTRPTQQAGWQKGALAAGTVLQAAVVGLHGVPNGATTALLNVTVTQPDTAGWAAVYPCGEPRPLASSVNFTRGLTVANAATAQIGSGGRVCLYTTARTHVVVDLVGFYPGTSRPAAAGSTYIRAQTSTQTYAVEPGGSVLPVSAADLAAAGDPVVRIIKDVPGTTYQRPFWSDRVFAVAPTGPAARILWPEYVALGTPDVRSVSSVPGTRFVKTSNSATVYAILPDGSHDQLSAQEHKQAGSPAAAVVIAAPGSRFVRTERAPHVYAMAPDQTTRHLTKQEYTTIGSPVVEVLAWRPAFVAVKASDVWASYRSGCPVPPGSLTRLVVAYWDFAGRLRSGAVVVATSHSRTIEGTMRAAFDAHFPLQELTPVEKYRGDDVASMQAGNTSAFNCRPVVGNPTRLSQHSYGNAIDINPAQNPYVTPSRVYPAGSQSYLNRAVRRPGMLFAGEPVVGALSGAGWFWGARWAHPDYHHFSSNGG